MKKPLKKFSVTRKQIVELYKKWEMDARLGKCSAVEICKAMSLEENAQKSADAFFNYLKAV